LVQLKAQALRAETVLRDLTGNQDKTHLNEKRSYQNVTTVPSASVKFDGPGLEPLKGKLPWPVNSSDISTESKKVSDDLAKTIKLKGVDFNVLPGSAVKAVADGRVIYSGRMPGLGSICILDHGERSYSLYGRLGKIDVRVGEDIEAGAVLAASQDKEGQNSVIYFEIRKNGASVNPKIYFKRSLS
jgi:murein hydrolase activator